MLQLDHNFIFAFRAAYGPYDMGQIYNGLSKAKVLGHILQTVLFIIRTILIFLKLFLLVEVESLFR